MKTNNNRILIAAAAVLGIVLIGYLVLRSQSPAPVIDPQEVALAQLKEDSTLEPILRFYDGFPGFAQVSIAIAGANATERARNFLSKYQDLYLQNDPNLNLEVKRVDGDTVVFYQTYKGLRVYAAEIVVNLQGDTVFATVGNLLTSEVERQALVIAPAITDADAANLARAELDLPGAEIIGSPELVVFDPSFVSEAPAIVHLAWQLTLNGTETMQVLVDAHNGELLFSVPFSQDDLDLDMQDAEDEANAEEDACFWGSDDVNVGDEDELYSDYFFDIDAVNGYDQIFKAYEFYLDNFGRHSYDGDGGQLELFIHTTVANASWSPYCELLSFSTGWIDYDVMVHELTHGVVGETSGLIYANQSGALSESYADVMSVIADQFDGDSNWTHGENRTGFFGWVRDLSIPKHVDDYVLSPNTKAGDWGGVHTNSSIPNYAAFLIATGGGPFSRPSPLPPYSITGIGTSKTVQLYYAVMVILPEGSSFSMASGLTIAMAESWAATSTQGFTADDACQVRNVFANVGLEELDFDCDGIPDGNDNDVDGDGVPDFEDNCNVANPMQTDENYDGIGDACQPDADEDGVPEGFGFYDDNCPDDYNPDQEDLNFNGIGQACDPSEDDDFDNDYVKNNVDNCVFDHNPGQENVDAEVDDLGDACDPDADGDGLSNDNDNCPFTANTERASYQANSDGDFAGDACDACPAEDDVNAWTMGIPELGIDPKPMQQDSDEDGIPNACDNERYIGDFSWDLGIKDVEELERVEVMLNGEPGELMELPLPACPDEEDKAPRLDRKITLEGVDPNIFLQLVSGEGMGAGKPKFEDGNAMLHIANPRGGDQYFLQIYFGPRYQPGESKFIFSYDCTEPDEEQPAAATATPIPTVELIAIPNQNANCRLGPSSASFESVDILFMGSEYKPIGRGPDDMWLLFDGPDYAGNCWVFIEGLDLFLNHQPVEIGDVPESVLPVVPYPDFPTATPTPTFTPEPFRPECNDGIDNDGDGDIDLADGRCIDANDNDESS